jgi:hypothetical protein
LGDKGKLDTEIEADLKKPRLEDEVVDRANRIVDKLSEI